MLQVASSAAFYIFTFFMFEKIYKRKELTAWNKILILIAAVLLIVIGLIHKPILNYSYSLLSMILLNKLLYYTNGKSYIIYDTILLVVMAAIEMLAVSFLSIIINTEIGKIIGNPYLLSAAAVLNWILLFLAIRIYIYLTSTREITNIKTQEFMFFSILISGEMFFLHFINDFLVSSKVKYEFTIILIVFLFIDLYLAYLLYKLSESYELEKKYDLVTQQSQLQHRAYKDLNEKYNASRKIVHDVKKHIALLEGLISQNNMEAANKYKRSLSIELDKLVPQFECDSPILTVIINNKIAVAESKNIDFDLNIEFSELDFISDLDITSIFSNLLDNAFEACEELPKSKRNVQLTITRFNYFLIISLKNAYKTINVNENEKFASTKENHQGIGLSNIQCVIDKYDGYFDINADLGTFKSEIVIPIPNNMSFKES